MGDETFHKVEPPRKLWPWERQVIAKILATPQPFADAAASQLATARVSRECGHCPSVDFTYPTGVELITDAGQPVLGALRPIRGRDRDGMFVEAVLIVTDGLVSALDVWRGDGQEFSAPSLDGFAPVPD
jgi:hypothetical protein